MTETYFYLGIVWAILVPTVLYFWMLDDFDGFGGGGWA